MKKTLSHRFIALLFLFALLLSPRSGRAAGTVEMGTDVIFSGLYGPAKELSARTHTSVLIGSEKLSAGAVYYFEPQHSYLMDHIIGGGVRMGDRFFVELDGGLFLRNFDGTVGRGFAVAAIPGFNFTKNFRLSVAVVTKRIASGLAARWIVDLTPYLGLRVRF